MREMRVAEQRYKAVMAVINEGRTSPHQMAAAVEVELLEMRRAKPYWGARRLALELRRKGALPAPSKSAIYRSLVRAGVIDPLPRQRRREKWKRSQLGAPLERWQLDVGHSF